MKFALQLVVLCLAFACLAREAHADLGWTEDQYDKVYGPGQRGMGKVNEKGYPVGQNYVTVEFSADNTHSIGELWTLGVVRDNIPDKVTKAGDAAMKEPVSEVVRFAAKSSLPAEIHETVIDDVVVRIDVRNQLINRIAFCGKKPTCGWWQRIFGPPCEQKSSCSVMDRALSIDRTMDDLHKRAEEAVERMMPRH